MAAATTVGDAGFERSEALIDAGVDMVVIDTAHGHSEGVAAKLSPASKSSLMPYRSWRAMSPQQRRQRP